MIFPMLVGAIGSAVLKKMKPKLYVYMWWVLAAYCGYIYFVQKYYSELSYFVMCASIGAVAAYAVLVGMEVFVGPLMGKFPAITNYYVRRGIVQKKGTFTEHGSTSTASQGVFGNVNVHTQHYSVDHDQFLVKDKDGSEFVVSGTFMSNQAKVGDEIVVGGVPGNRHCILINADQQARYESKIANPVGAVLTGILMAIPALGELCVVVMFSSGILLSKIMRFKGAISELPAHNERANQGFSLAYHALAAVSALMLIQAHNYKMAAIAYFAINLGVGIVHNLLWQKDLVRFHSYLADKMRASA